MKIVIVSGSHHLNSQSLKISEYLSKRSQHFGCDAEVVDLATANLPFWSGPHAGHAHWKKIQPKFESADGYIVVCPEWGGMVTPQLKNLFLYTTSKEVGHKPALITSISAGAGGAYPVSELRMSGYKNTKICYIPEHLVVRGVAQVLNTPNDSNGEDQRMRERVDHHLQVLKAYAESMKTMRINATVDLHEFPHGM
ncbi:MAG: NADPH-dependent FMN reductase [Oligoflexales bacterium]